MIDDWTVGPYTLREHQKRSVVMLREAMADCLKSGDKPRVILQGVCGFGKTIVSSYLMKQAIERQKKPAFIVHGRTLVLQKSDKLCDAMIPHEVVMADIGGQLRAAANRYTSGTPNCAVISKDTYESMLDRGDTEPFQPGLWIVDEAHTAKSDSWWKLFEKSPAPMIGLTATPVWSNGLGMGDRWSRMVCAATHVELIQSGMLVPCRVFSPWGVDTRGVNVNGETGEFVQEEIAERCEPLVGDFVESWWKLAEGRTTAFFASSVPHSIAQTQAFREGDGTLVSRPLVWEHIDAETPKEERRRINRGLASGDIDGVSNYAVLRIGWDNPAVGCLQFGVAMRNGANFLQGAGRGARPNQGKADFILIDHGFNVEEHGWPQEDRDWPLDRRKPMWERSDDSPRAEHRVCKNCGTVFKATLKLCPNCGFRKVVEGRMVKTASGQLVEVAQSEFRPREYRRVSDEQKAWERMYYASANSKSARASTFNSLRMMFQRKHPHLRIVADRESGVTRIVNLHTKAKHTLGMVPPPDSPHWDWQVRSVQKSELQSASYIPKIE